MKDPRPVILFDGVCNLCNATVRWIVKRDSRRRFHFASLQSAAARRLLASAGHEGGVAALPDAIVLVDRDGVHTASTAAVRVARHLRFPYPVLTLALVLPRPLRDAAYSVVARNRYKWFGQRESCASPAPGQAHRFLDANENRPPGPHVATPAAGRSGRVEPGTR